MSQCVPVNFLEPFFQMIYKPLTKKEKNVIPNVIPNFLEPRKGE